MNCGRSCMIGATLRPGSRGYLAAAIRFDMLTCNRLRP